MLRTCQCPALTSGVAAGLRTTKTFTFTSRGFDTTSGDTPYVPVLLVGCDDNYRHVIICIFYPRFLSKMASYDVASTILSIIPHIIQRIAYPYFLT
jgi:hypothetical protein